MPLSARQIVLLRALVERAPVKREAEDQDAFADLSRRGLVRARADGARLDITVKGRAALDVYSGIRTAGTQPKRRK